MKVYVVMRHEDGDGYYYYSDVVSIHSQLMNAINQVESEILNGKHTVEHVEDNDEFIYRSTEQDSQWYSILERFVS